VLILVFQQTKPIVFFTAIFGVNLSYILRVKYQKILVMINPWHDVNIGKNAPDFVMGVIEIPKGSKGKYELDKKTGMLILDRVLFSAVHYPANYGFIPQTFCDDKDPLDILIISQIDIPSMTLVNAKVIGVMRMVDGGEADDKIIAVAAEDQSVNYINDIDELPPHLMKEVHRFFEDYKKLENKEVKVEDFLGKEEAFKIIKESIDLYDLNFRTKR
jgi:inorganic pyrophosphatase